MASVAYAIPQAALVAHSVFKKPTADVTIETPTAASPQTIPESKLEVEKDSTPRDPHLLPSFTEDSLSRPSEPVLYLPPLLSSLPPSYPHIEPPSEQPPLHTETRLPDIDPASLSLHRALHHFKPRVGYASLPYDTAFNWNELILPEEDKREWYIVAFRSKRKDGSDGSPLYEADRLAHEEAVVNGGLIMYWYGVPDPVTGLNLATCIWQSRAHAVAANSRPHHIRAMKLAASSYEVYTLERHVLRKEKGATGVTIEEFVGGDVACFNVCTGDLEDAPAVNGIHSFVTEIKDGKIYVTAREEDTLKANMARSPALSSLLESQVAQEGPGDGVVIVGGGAATIHAIESLRLYNYGGHITVLASETYAPIDRTKLSKTLMSDTSKLEWRRLDVLREKYLVNYRTDVQVTSVDTDAKTVTIGGSETVKYGKLILAVGSKPKKLPVEGADLENVFTLRQVPDAKRIDTALQPGKNLVVIGSSFISMELVVAVAKRQLASIHVVGQSSVPFKSILGEAIGKGIMNYHINNGVKFHMGQEVKALKASPSSPGAVGSVILNDGTEIPADVVIFGVGVRPATEFLKGTQLEEAIQKDGGLKVDKQLQVEGFDDVFAIGDIAVYPQAQGGDYKRIEHWNVASNHGRAVGKTIGRREDKLAAGFAKVPIFWSAQGQQLRYCGVGEGWDDVIIRGNPDEMKFAAFYLKEGKVIAVASMQMDPVVTRSAELFRLGLMPTADEIRAGADLLSIDIVSKKV
ncbi:hypothetical protein FRB99_006690 [Tulasnella sp. 403]|nr:hypothetical protein FRB99_006690 [Tulasnella sp. 403]